MAEEEQLVINMDVDSNGGGEEEEEFYENIEAPKFVDLTAADHYHPDDRYWFCLRVGCDQKHEEELDSEAIYKNFVLRVMAARSPNVRLQKALNRTASSKYMKCPGSAPPKSSKPRLSRLAVISSISGRLVDNKGKIRPQPKLIASTPKTKTKQVAAKYLTTPRNKKCLPNPNSFRSVQNPKPTPLAVPKNRIVAKALVFHSPKKGIAVKTSVELRTPLSKLCEGKKRLELTNQRKRVLGTCSKPSEDRGLGSDKSLPVNSSRKQRVTFQEQSSEKNQLQSQTRSRSMKSKMKGNLTKQWHSKGTPADGSSAAMNTGSKLREDNEEHPSAKKILGRCSSIDHQLEEVEGNDVQRALVPNKKEDDCGEGDSQYNVRADLESPVYCTDSAENHTSERAGRESQVTDSDDKENASKFDENRDLSNNNNEITNKDKQKEAGNIKKAARALEKSLKEGTPGMKFRKPRTTNPKPFRFRTDERGILKEANLEKKVHPLARTKDCAKASRFIDVNPHRNHDKNIYGKEKPAGHQDKCTDEMPENSQKESQRSILSDLKKRSRMNTNTPKGQEASESAKIASPLNRNCSRHMETSSRKMRSPLRTNLVQPQKLASSRVEESSSLTPGQKLRVINETSPLVSKPKRKGERDENTHMGSEPSRRRRPVTIPKEPNFHSSHRPKSCTMQIG